MQSDAVIEPRGRDLLWRRTCRLGSHPPAHRPGATHRRQWPVQRCVRFYETTHRKHRRPRALPLVCPPSFSAVVLYAVNVDDDDDDDDDDDGVGTEWPRKDSSCLSCYVINPVYTAGCRCRGRLRHAESDHRQSDTPPCTENEPDCLA